MGRPKEKIGLLKHVLCPLFVDCYSHNYQYHCYYYDYSYSFHLFLMVTCFETMQFWINIVRPSGMSPNFFGGMAKTREAWQPDRGFDIAAGRNKWPNLMHCSLFARFSWSLWRPSSNSPVFFWCMPDAKKTRVWDWLSPFFSGKDDM